MRKILMIGASSSIGQEIVKEFLSSGDQVLASYNTNKIKFTGLAKNNLHSLKLDINCGSSRKAFLSSIKNFWSEETQRKLKLQRETINSTYSWDVRSVEWKNFFYKIKNLNL